MPRTGKAALLVALLHASPAIADDAPRMLTVITPNPVSERESVQLQLSIEAPVERTVTKPTFDAPDFVQAGTPGLDVKFLSGDSGPNTRKRVTHTFVLMPKKAGDYFIRNLRAFVAGSTVSSNDIPVKVLADNSPRAVVPAPPGTVMPGGNDDEASNPASPSYRGGSAGAGDAPARRALPGAPDRFNSDFTVWANVSKTRAYVGEPIVVEFHAFDFGGVKVLEQVDWPSFQGFWHDDLELNPRLDWSEVFVKQQEVRRALIGRYALSGIKPGKFTLDKLGMKAKYMPSNVLTPGFTFGYEMRTGHHYSQDVPLEILPLPEAGRPAGFGGAVGKFTISLTADRLSLPQNTPVTLTLTLAGVGNFQAITALRPPLPADFELFESNATGRPVLPVGARQELESKKTFTTVAIPRKPGKFKVPALSFAFFNPEKEAYETVTTPALQIEVTPNEAGAAGSNSYLGPRPSDPGSPAGKGEELHPLKVVSLGSHRGLADFLPFALWALLLANLALAVRHLRGRARGLVKLVKGIDRFSEARIALLQAKGIRDAEWQAGLEEVVLMTMQVLLETNPRGLARSDLEELWKSRGLPAPLFQRAIALLDEIDRHRFSSQKLAGSGSKEVRSRLTKEAESLLSEAPLAAKKKK